MQTSNVLKWYERSYHLKIRRYRVIQRGVLLNSSSKLRYISERLYINLCRILLFSYFLIGRESFFYRRTLWLLTRLMTFNGAAVTKKAELAWNTCRCRLEFAESVKCWGVFSECHFIGCCWRVKWAYSPMKFFIDVFIAVDCLLWLLPIWPW